MTKAEEQLEALKDIRNIMERSSRFLSLNGLSGVFVGLIALAGALAAYLFIGTKEGNLNYFDYARDENGQMNLSFISFFLLDAISVLVSSILVSMYLTIRKARKQGVKVWTVSGKRLVWSMLIPLFSGGAFCLIMVFHGYAALVAPATLVFYGLALINASKYTYENVRFLGITEIILGLFAAVFIAHGLLFWALGFGVAHMVYGIAMYFLVEKNVNA